MSFFTVLFVNDKSHLKLTAAVKGLLWSGWIQPDLRIWLSSQFDILLYFSMERKKKTQLSSQYVKEKHLKVQLSPASYLARWSTASTMFVPSLALVSQNRAPYACGAKNGHSEDSSVYLESVSLKHFPWIESLNTPWPASLPAECWHSCPLDAVLAGPPCFQQYTSGFCHLWSPAEKQRKLKRVHPGQLGHMCDRSAVTWTWSTHALTLRKLFSEVTS